MIFLIVYVSAIHLDNPLTDPKKIRRGSKFLQIAVSICFRSIPPLKSKSIPLFYPLTMGRENAGFLPFNVLYCNIIANPILSDSLQYTS